MPNIPDFSLKQSFPMASVIEAVQRRAQIEQQNREFQSQQLVQGLQAFGGMADSLVKRRQQMAQAAKMGSALGMTPDETQGMTPEQVVQVGTAKGKVLDLLQLAVMHDPTSVNQPWFQAALAAHSPASAPTSQSQASAQAVATPEAVLASASPTIPIPQSQTPVASPSPVQAPSLSQSPLTPATTRPMDLLQTLFKKPMNPATSAAALKMLGNNVPVMTTSDALGKGSVPKGTIIKDEKDGTGGKADNEYDKLEGQVINRIVGIRGDKSLARTEEQRDAAMQAFNTIASIKNEHRLPNQLEYYDILGQMWKARTGSSPTDQAIRDLDVKTLKGDLGKAYQYFSGDAAPRTTEGVMDAIQKFADVSGKQADKLHSGYMQSHLVKPKNMSQNDFDRVVKANRGMSFEEGTAESRIHSTGGSAKVTSNGTSYTVNP